MGWCDVKLNQTALKRYHKAAKTLYGRSREPYRDYLIETWEANNTGLSDDESNAKLDAALDAYDTAVRPLERSYDLAMERVWPQRA